MSDGIVRDMTKSVRKVFLVPPSLSASSVIIRRCCCFRVLIFLLDWLVQLAAVQDALLLQDCYGVGVWRGGLPVRRPSGRHAVIAGRRGDLPTAWFAGVLT